MHNRAPRHPMTSMTSRALALFLGLCFGMVGATAQATTTLMSDDFKDGNAAGWTPTNGAEWSVVSDGTELTYHRAATAATWNDSLIGQYSWTDTSVEATVRVNSWVSPGNASNMAAVYARYSGNSPSTTNGYFVTVRGDGSIGINKRTNGVNVSLSSFPAAGLIAGSYYTVRLEVIGANPVRLNAYLNGVLRVTAVDANSWIANGQVGFGTFGADASFDNFVVTDGDVIGAESWMTY
jgi:pectate lyase